MTTTANDTKATRSTKMPTTQVAAAIAVAVLAALVMQVFFVPAAEWGGEDNPGAWNPPHSRAELLVAKMDGHTFAEIASDPLMSDTTDAYFGDEANAAYRSARPVFGWILWAASLGGQRDLIAPAAIVLTALSMGLLALATDFLARTLGARRVPLLPVVLVTPVGIAAIAYPGIADPLANALALFGAAMWLRGSRSWSVALLVAAVLTRETTLFIAFGLAVEAGWRALFARADDVPAARRLTDAVRASWLLLLPPVAYLGWTAVVHARIGAWPSDYSQMDGLGVGFSEGFPNWRPAEWAAAAMLLAAAAVIVRIGPIWMKGTLAGLAVFALFMNYQVWWVWLGFGRVATMLVLLALALMAARLVPVEEAAGPPPERVARPVA